MFYYKFNLKLPNTEWIGTKACKKKHLISPQWLRNIKDRKYPIYRLDTLFSDKKYISVKIINNGGWHFSNIKSAEEIEHKLKSYLHHLEFDINPLSIDEIENGKMMFIFQAQLAFKIWHNILPKVNDNLLD